MAKSKGRNRNNWFDWLNMLLLGAFSLIIIFPFWDIIVRSFSDPIGANTLKFMILPVNFTTSAYTYLMGDTAILQGFLVTVSRTILGTALSVMLVMMAAYPLSSKLLPGRNFLQVVFLIPMFFGGGLIPTYLTLRSYGLIDNFLVYLLPGAVGLYNVVLARNFIMSIDRGLEESAFIDGADYGTIFFKIILPVSSPIVATLALWIAVGHWNSWFDSMIYIRKNNLRTVQYILYKMRQMAAADSEELLDYLMLNPNAKITDSSIRMATTVVTMLPIMCVYPFVQKYFVKGIMVGSLKG